MKTAIICRTLGRVCGIAEYAIHLQKRLPGDVYLVNNVRDIQPDTELVIIQFEIGLYPDGPSSLVREANKAKEMAPGAYIVTDYHSIYRVLGEFKRHAITGIKRGWSSTKNIIQLPHLVNLPPEKPKPIPKELRLGTFGFGVPFKRFEMIMDLSKRLDLPLTLLASIPSPNDQVYQMCAVYMYKIKTYAKRFKKIDMTTKFLPVEEVIDRLQDCSHLISAQQDVYGQDGGPSGSMRVMVAAQRPIISIRNDRAAEAGAVLVDDFKEIDLDFLKAHTEPAQCPDGIEWYLNIIEWLEAAKKAGKTAPQGQPDDYLEACFV